MGRNNSAARIAERRARSTARAMPQPSAYRVRDGGSPREFYGIQLAHVSSEDSEAPRWTEMSLYRVSDGRYVLQTTGKSRIYHARGSACNAGVATRAAELPGTARACTRCAPRENTVYDLEIDLPAVHVRATARGIIDFFRAGEEYSSLAQRLLKEAALQDTDLGRELNAPVPL